MTEGVTRFYAEARDGVPPTRTRPRLFGAVVALFAGPRLLLELRADSDVWSLVGGAVDEDESVRAAAAREVREETGLELPREAELIAVVSDPARVVAYPGGSVATLMTVVLGAQLREIAKPVVSAESRRLAFFGADELPVDRVAATHRVILPIAFAWRAGDHRPDVD